jgi:hypothetical protein
MSQDRFAVRLIAEGLVMVLGILLAFQLENWREGRARYQLETAQLVAIRDDVLENQQRLEDVLALQRETVESGRILLAAHAGRLPAPLGDSLVVLFDNAESWWRLEPVTGAYDAMVGSGDVVRLRNQSLLRALASLAADLTSEFEDQQESMDLLAEMRRRAMSFGVGLTDPDLLIRIDPSAPMEAIAESVDSGAATSLLGDRSYAHLLARRITMEMNRLEWQDQLADRLSRTLALLEEELVDRGAT